MSYGLLAGVLIHGAVVTLTLVSPRRPFWLAGLSYRLAAAYNEVPVLLALVLLALTLPGVLDPATEPTGRAVALALTTLVVAGLVVIAWRGAQARPVVARALEADLEPRSDLRLDAEQRTVLERRPPLGHLLVPFVLRPRDVERVTAVPYGPAGRAHRLDLYRHRSRP